MEYQDLILTTSSFNLKRGSDGKRTAQFELGVVGVWSQPKLQVFDWNLLNQLRKAATAPAPRWEDALALGRALADILLPTELRSVLMERLTQQQALGKGLRVRLQLSGELNRLPWEFMAVNRAGGEMTPQDFLVLMPHLSIVRQPASTLPVWEIAPKPLEQVRVLVALASPEDQPPLDVAGEQTRLESVFGAHPQIQAEYVPHATASALVDGHEAAHLFHFAGHGTFTPAPISAQPGKLEGQGHLLLETEAGFTDRFDAAQLGITLRSKNVRVALLGACYSAERDDLNQWSGVSEALLKADVGAVVGMQFAVKDSSAIAFAGRFYAALLAGMTIDEAVQAGRVTLAAGEQDVRGFGTPVLYLRDSDGVVFPELAQLPAKRTEQAQIAEATQGELDTTHQIPIKIDARGSQGVILNNTGSGTQHIGDNVNTGGGDYVKGNKSVNTGGGAYIAGNVQVGGDFVGRDKIVNQPAPSTKNSAQSQADQVQRLYDVLSGVWFSDEDLQGLSFRLKIDWENLPGEAKSAKARALVQYCVRHSRLDELYTLVKEARPSLNLVSQIILSGSRGTGSGGTGGGGTGSDSNDRQGMQPIRLDVAAPQKVVVEQAFDLAVAVRKPDSPKRREEGLDNEVSTRGTIVRKDPKETVKFSVSIVPSAAFQINPENYTFLLLPDTDSEVFFFSVVAKQKGQHSIIINASQTREGIVVASTRLLLVVDMQVEPSARPPLIENIKDKFTLKKSSLQSSGENITKLDLLNQLDRVFNENELNELLFALELDIENIQGTTRRATMMEIIKFFVRRDELSMLIEAMQRIRPNAFG